MKGYTVAMITPPAEGSPSSRALFWFLTWFDCKHGKAYSFETQKELANAAGISEDSVSRIIRSPPAWFIYDGKKASVKYPT
jgi:hypothetical protein